MSGAITAREVVVRMWIKIKQFFCRHKHWELLSYDDYTRFEFKCCKCGKVESLD